LTRYRSLEEREAEVRPLDLGLMLRMFQYTRPYAVKRNCLVLCVLLRSIQLPCLTWAIAAIIAGPITQGDTRGLSVGVAGFAALALFTQVVLHFRSRWALELGESVVHDLRNAIFGHLQRLPMSFYNKTKLGRIISRMTSDVENVRIGVQEVLFVSLVQVGQMTVAAAFMLWYDRTLFLLVLGLVPVLWKINRHFHRKLSQAHRDVQESFSRVTATLAESVSGMRVTQAFVRQDKNAAMFQDLVADHASYNFAVNKTQGVFLPLLDFNSELFVATLLVVGGFRVLHPEFGASVGDLVGFLFMANLFFTPISNLGTQYNQALTAMAGAERIFQLLDTEPEWSDPPSALRLPSLAGRVEFRRLSFGYDPGRPVLRDLDFSAEPGQCIALVGHTGSGKSSIINLVAKFYLPWSGELLIDGQDIRGIETSSLHRQIAVVLQQNFLFGGTVLENIRMGRAGATDAEVLAAAERLDCLDLLMALPEGLQTPVGERGGNLSLGQRQLVCFTRAMLANPRILILDEATSSVDPITEYRIQQALGRLLEGRTSFVVAHRLSTIRHADQVLVLDHGRIVERGTHDELLDMGGVYAELYRNFAQASAA
jgi:ATP-binding cassette subfamily B protein